MSENISLTNYPDQIPDPSLYFVDNDQKRLPLVIEHATGLPIFVIDTTHPDSLTNIPPLIPWEPDGKKLFQSLNYGVGVRNPPGFVGFPDHDTTNPAYDINLYANQLGGISNLDKYFVDFDCNVPRIVEHETGKVVLVLN